MTDIDVLVLPGDGIGPEITDATLIVLAAADRRFGLGLRFTRMNIGFAAYEQTGTTLPDAVMEAARAREAILVGPISHMDYPPRDKGGVNVSAALRVRLDLYANIRPARTRAGVPRRGGDMDLVIVRESTEGMYPDRNMFRGSGEFMPDPDTAMSLRKITRKACTRIARRAFEIASTRRKRVAAIHKANNFILTDGLFLECVRAVAAEFPDVAVEELIVDATAALLVREPARFDTIVSTNFYCDILSDLASELCGGLGLAGAVNANDERCAAQAQHGSAPDIQGKGIANPSSLILSAAMMLDWIARKHGRPEFAAAAGAVERAIDACVANPATRTRDLGGALGTADFAARVAETMA